MATLDYSSMKINDIIEWCKDNNEVDWLKKTALAEDENGKKPNFFVIKKAFCKKFMPEIMPKGKKKMPTMYEVIGNL